MSIDRESNMGLWRSPEGYSGRALVGVRVETPEAESSFVHFHAKVKDLNDGSQP